MKHNTIKVLGVNGSARADGNTAIIMRMVFAELNQAGIKTELIQLNDKEIAPCKGCFVCKGKSNCVLRNDAFAEIFEKMCAADGILLGSPVYSASVSAKMKALLERAGVVVATNSGLLKSKIGAAVSAVRRGGGMTAVDTMNHFFLNKEMIVVGSTYWNMVYGRTPGEVKNDSEGVANMHNLGSNMAKLLLERRKNILGPDFTTPAAHVKFLAKKFSALSGTFQDGTLSYLEPGGGGPRTKHTHAHDHLFLVIQGEARIEFEHENVFIKANEIFHVQGELPHSVWNNSNSTAIILGLTIPIKK